MSSSGLILVMLFQVIWMINTALVSQFNNVLCFFRTLDSVTKMRLLISYCYSYTGALSGILPVLMLRKYVALEELECVVFGAFRSILTMC